MSSASNSSGQSTKSNKRGPLRFAQSTFYRSSGRATGPHFSVTPGTPAFNVLANPACERYVDSVQGAEQLPLSPESPPAP